MPVALVIDGVDGGVVSGAAVVVAEITLLPRDELFDVSKART